MTIVINENSSLLASLLQNRHREQSSAGVNTGSDGFFAGKLDSILGRESLATQSVTTAQSLAETLNLQMLRTTMTLAVDEPDAATVSPMFDHQSSTIQALIKAYSANTQAAGVTPAQPAAANQPLPDVSVAPLVTESKSTHPSQGDQWLDPIIAKASRRYGVDAGLIKAVIKAESNFNPKAVSHAGARGLMQLMPGTARSLGVNDSFDPEQNVMGGTRFLGDLLNRYNGNIDSALAAYNWGPGNVDKRPERLPRETRDYLVRVKQLYATYTA